MYVFLLLVEQLKVVYTCTFRAVLSFAHKTTESIVVIYLLFFDFLISVKAAPHECVIRTEPRKS